MEDTTGLIVRLLQASKSVHGELTSLCAENDLSADEYLILDALVRFDELSMLELTEHGTVSGATLTRVVDKLVGKALVYRALSPTDRRQIRVRLAPLGIQVHQDLWPRVAELENALATALSPCDDHESSVGEGLGELRHPGEKHPSAR